MKVIIGIAKYTCMAVGAAVILLLAGATFVAVGIEDNEMPL